MAEKGNTSKRPDDRKLGDEWADWDGRATPEETAAGKRLFFALSGLVYLFVGLAGAGAWYMTAPRLAQWHALAPAAALAVLGAVLAALGGLLAAVALVLWRGRPLPGVVGAAARRLVVTFQGPVFSLGQRLRVSTDRTAHSLIRINNSLVQMNLTPAEAAHVLVLLPRCLTRETIGRVRELAEGRGVQVAVVGGGEAARKRIREHRPQMVIGVACERDLVSGIRDVGHRLRVVGIPNRRPNGPCRDTHIDLRELEEVLCRVLDGGQPRCEARCGAPADVSRPNEA